MKGTTNVFLLSLISIGFMAMTALPQTDWFIPPKYKDMSNPVEVEGETMAIGKQLWSKHCRSCHGREGLGDGPKAAELDTPSGDFSSDEFQDQSDGVLFIKTTVGRDEMPGYASRIPNEEDRWILVHYMRTFAR